MMKTTAGKSEHIIQDVAGCGPFQVLLVFSIFGITHVSVICTNWLMAFGNYNPGYRCLDNTSFSILSGHTNNSSFYDVGNSNSNSNTSTTNTSMLGYNYNDDRVDDGDYTKDNCTLYESCTNIQFSPDTSTIVTEWGLVCGKAWVPSLIISIQMIGLLVGCSLGGYLGDALGRKTTIYGAISVQLVFNSITVFATSWEMFAVFRFFLGVETGCFQTIFYVYLSEFVTVKWRSPLSGIPFYAFSGTFFAVFAMVIRNWRQLHIVFAVASLIALTPALWLPESLRWLEVKNKKNKFETAASRIVRMNRKTSPDIELFESTIGSISTVDVRDDDKDKEKAKKSSAYNIFHLFKTGYRRNTLLLSVPWFSMSLTMYAITFGVKALSGNFYINLMIMQAIDIPFSVVPIFVPNLIGRKKSSILFGIITASCLIGAAVVHRVSSSSSSSSSEELKSTGVFIFVVLGKMVLAALWSVTMCYTVEIYPTVIRGLGTSWGNIVARIGGIVAPVLIPQNDDSVFVCYVVMGALTILCCAAIAPLPETKGKALEENYKSGKKERADKKEMDIFLPSNNS